MKYAFINSTIFSAVDEKTILNKATLLTDDYKIVAVETETFHVPFGYEIIDLKGKFLMPGMINLHAHLFGKGRPSGALKGGGLQKLLVRFAKSTLGKPVIDAMVKSSAEIALNSGVTTIRSSGDLNYSDIRIRNKIHSGELLGPRLIVPGPIITCIGGHGEGTIATTSDDVDELIAFVEERKKNGADYIKICVTGGVMDAKVKGEPGITKMTLEQTRAITRRAHELGMKVASHTESSKGIKIALEGGVDSIEHGSYLDDELVDLFLKKKAVFVVTTSPAIPLSKLSPEITKLDEMAAYNSGVVLDGMIKGAKIALANKIPVGIGTDSSCPLVTQYNFWREVYWFAKYYGVSNGFALYTATRKNAEIAGIESVTGTIEKGKCADLIILNNNPMNDLKLLKDINMVMAKGDLIKNPHIKKNSKVEKWLDSID